jgi:iron(III) transport system permease protein
MFTQKRVLSYLALTIAFGLVAYWAWNNLGSAFVGLSERQAEAATAAIVSSAPADPALMRDLPARHSDTDTQLALYAGFPGMGDAPLHAGTPELGAFLADPANRALVEKGAESAMYEEPFQFPGQMRVGGRDALVFFHPVKGEDGMVAGVAVAASDFSRQVEFLQLLRIVFLAAVALFLFVAGVLKFARDPITGFAVVGLFAIVGVFIAYPIFEAARLTFMRDGEFSLATWRGVFNSAQYIAALKRSLTLGAITASVSTVLGYVFAFAIARTSVRWKGFFSAMATLPVISPPFTLTLSIILLFGRNGLISKQILGLDMNVYGLWGLVLAQVIGMFPIAYMTLAGVLAAIDSTMEEAALNLSAGRFTTFRTVTLPLSLPGVLSAWLLVFVNSLADFANPLILGGNYYVLSVEAYNEAMGMNRMDWGAALSFLLLMPTITAFLVQRYWISRRSFVTVTGKPSGRLIELVGPGGKSALTLCMGAVSLFIVALYATVVAGCFVKNWGIDNSFSTENIVEAVERGWDSITATVTLSAAATPVAGFLAMAAALLIARKTFPMKRLLEILIMTPFALPGTLLGISYVMAFNKPPLLLVGTGLIIVVNFVIREFPVGMEGGIASLKQIDPAIEEAAMNLGADTSVVFKDMVLPLIRPAFISALSYTFVRSMTAVSAVIFLITAEWQLLTMQIYNFSENTRFGLASVLSTVLIFIVFFVFWLMRRLLRSSGHMDKTISAG